LRTASFASARSVFSVADPQTEVHLADAGIIDLRILRRGAD
jgi:hypothetical protein